MRKVRPGKIKDIAQNYIDKFLTLQINTQMANL